ncbi:tetratricopeptide repeat protein [Streptomyces canus]|uniref:tetratricopeptide repeat protein n=1 Tax=Streptomyces canus TaxID=58343 RepID=UPI002DDC15B6|nr:tetratricopeptide repeat protein [Streptomyces canus]WSD82899.1 tetratricopeptide repeat protein [Streptomyces canus]WSD91935.1 tetratricopeptide repeat protein [Streptomyces canus]WSD92576.1 tetratricopeptide repeat protein [Streptomyces canus]
MTVAATGDAKAWGEETVVTGYRGPAPESGDAPVGPVHVSRTGDGTASNGGTVITGYVHNLTVQQHPRQEPAPWPHQVGVIPPAARSFQHRAEIQRLRIVANGGGTTVLTQLLTGMGGVGKTQLAADYARTAWENTSATGGLDVLVWVPASNRDSIVAGYAQAGVELCRADPDDAEQAARSFLAWLAPKAGAKVCRWLIVLDDVADPDDLKGLWPPTSPHGRALVTTRRRDAALAGDGRRAVEVGLFTKNEALMYLTTSLAGHGRAESAARLSALADDLGYLPLALAQAAACIVDTGETVDSYRKRLADRRTTLAAVTPEVLPDDQALPLAAAWSLSIERADALKPAGLARPMLQLASLLDANGIPQTVLTSSPARTHLAAHRTDRQRTPRREWWPGRRLDFPEPATPEEAIGALRALHRLSLIDHTPDFPHTAVRVHQLIQRATRDTLAPSQHDQTARTAADALIAAWPVVEHDTALAQSLRANTTALTQCAEDPLYRPGVHAVLYRTGTSLGETGQISAARAHYQHITNTATARLGENHPDTLTAQSNLALWRGQMGDVTGSAESFTDLHKRMVRVLGRNHRDTLNVQGHLAALRGQAGDPAGAAEDFAALLQRMVKALGKDHPLTLITRDNLALWRTNVGDVEGAAHAFAGLLADRIRVLGEDHPQTLNTWSNLVYCQGEAGDPAGAAEAFADVLAARIRVLGNDHPDTLSTRNNLAFWRWRMGDATGAADVCADLLADRIRVLGEDHPQTLATRNNLAGWRGEAGDAAGAAEAFADVLAARIRVLGPDHPDTLITRGNLASWRGKAGDAAEAVDAYADVLAARIRVLGPDHPDTLTTRGHLASWRGKAGDAAGAVDAYADLLEQMIRVLGPDHPHTLTALHNLAYWRGHN